jgi:electron transport complex protein RnfE
MARVQDFTKGIWKENPVLRLMLGLCPTLAVSTAVDNAVGMGVAFTVVLLGSNIVISLIRGFIPKQVRIPCFIVVIATFVTIIELTMQAFQPKLHEALGIFVPLIVVNCIVLGRAEAFASRNTLAASVLDALGMGAGFTLALFALAFVRELLGTGMVSLFGRTIVPGPFFQPAIIMILPPGAFVTLGLMMALMNKIGDRAPSTSTEEAAGAGE